METKFIKDCVFCKRYKDCMMINNKNCAACLQLQEPIFENVYSYEDLAKKP